MQSKNKKTLFFLIFLIFLAATIYFKNQLFPMIAGLAGHAPTAAPAAAMGQMPPMAVETVIMQKKPMAAEVKAVGTLQADESVILRPEVAGRVAQINFKEGEAVKKDQLLIALDESLYRAEMQESIASRDLAKQIYERSKALFEKGTGTANARDDNRLKWQAAEASVSLSKARLAKMRLTAPFDGVIGVRSVSVGDYVAPGQDLVGVTKLDPLKLDFRIAETYLNNVQIGQKINLTTASSPGQIFNAEIYAIDPQIDAETRSVILRASVPNADKALRPGAFAQVTIPLGGDLTALMVPEQAVIPTGGSQSVYKVVDGKAVTAIIKTGFRNEGMVQVVEGLAEGDEVVTAGQMKIRDGAPVAPVPAQPGAAPAAKPAAPAESAPAAPATAPEHATSAPDKAAPAAPVAQEPAKESSAEPAMPGHAPAPELAAPLPPVSESPDKMITPPGLTEPPVSLEPATEPAPHSNPQH